MLQKKKISTGSALLVQMIVLSVMVSVSLCFLTAAILLGDSGLWITFLLFLPISFGISRRALQYADVYIVGDHILCQNIIKAISRPISDICAIDQGLHYNNYFIEFIDRQKVYFEVKKGRNMIWPNNDDRSDTIAYLRQRFGVRSPKWL